MYQNGEIHCIKKEGVNPLTFHIKYLTPYQRHYSLDKNIIENRKRVYTLVMTIIIRL